MIVHVCIYIFFNCGRRQLTLEAFQQITQITSRHRSRCVVALRWCPQGTGGLELHRRCRSATLTGHCSPPAGALRAILELALQRI